MIETMTFPAQIPRPVRTKLRTTAIPAAGKVKRRRNMIASPRDHHGLRRGFRMRGSSHVPTVSPQRKPKDVFNDRTRPPSRWIVRPSGPDRASTAILPRRKRYDDGFSWHLRDLITELVLVGTRA